MSLFGKRFKVMKKREDMDDEGAWIHSYADMVTLLFAFFVVLVSISNISMVKYELMTKYFTKDSGRMTSKDLKEKIKEFVKAQNLEDQIDVNLTSKGVEISFKDKLLFSSGKAELKSASYGILTSISDLLKYEELAHRKISIEGHTDSLPIKTKIYPSNWELSSGRAANVVRFFTSRKLINERFESIGYADTRPIVSPIPGVLSQPENRRVVMVISPDSYLAAQERFQIDMQAIENEGREQEQQSKSKMTSFMDLIKGAY